MKNLEQTKIGNKLISLHISGRITLTNKEYMFIRQVKNKYEPATDLEISRMKNIYKDKVR